jgi:hypothetical protein
MLRLKNLILLSEKTLYHGTLIDNVPSIKRYGLLPSVGKFVKNAYDMSEYDVDEENYLKELVFATEKKQLGKAVVAITAQISYKLNKGLHDVTDDEFIKHGAIAVIKDGDDLMSYRTDTDNDSHPYTAEPGDYYSEDYIGVDYILTGNKMISLLEKYGEWPRDFGKVPVKTKKEFLIRLAIKRNPTKNKMAILNIINSWNDKLIDSYYNKHIK